MVFPVTALGAGLVALLSFVVSGAGYRAMVRSGNPALGYVIAAFLVLGAKNVVKLAFLVGVGSVPYAWEVAFVGADVATVTLVAWPFLRRLGP